MLLYLSLTGIILSVVLMYFNTRNFKSSTYLSIYFLIISIYGLNQYVLLHSKSVFWVTVFCTHFTFLYYLIGPLFYWYIRSVLDDDSRFRKQDLIHLLPMMVYLIAAIPYYIAPLSYKLEIAAKIVENPGILGEINFTILSELFSVIAVYITRSLLILGYLLWSFIMYSRFLKHQEELKILRRKAFMKRWLPSLFGFTFILIASYLLLLFQSFITESMIPFFTLNFLNILTGSGLAGLVISLFFFPDILYGIPRVPESAGNVSDEKMTRVMPVALGAYTPHFEYDYLHQIQAKAEVCMKEFQPYLQPQLNLNKFADILQLPAHHLAYFFREFKKQTFNDYNNECRIRYAKNLIFDGKTKDITLEAIGLLSGFTNRSTFFRAFKKSEGVSPAEFLVKFKQNTPQN